MEFASFHDESLSSDFLPADGPPAGQWKLPLSLAVGIHLLVLVMALSSPFLFKRPVLPEIYTVNLFNAVEATKPAARAPKAKQVAKPAPVKPREPQVKTLEKETVKKEVPVPETPAPPPSRPAISERPIKAKSADDLARLRELRSRLASQHASEVKQAADKKVEHALDSIRKLYQEEHTALPPPPSSTPAAEEPSPAGETEPGAGGGGDGVIVEAVLNRYYAQVYSRVRAHWALPELQNWDDSLESIVVIKVRRDGIVVDSFFEKRAANQHFNQNVEKAIREASPLPPFPPEIREASLEIGLRFRPGELF